MVYTLHFVLVISIYFDKNCQNVPLPQVLSKDFASKNQLPGFSVDGTLVKNGLIERSCISCGKDTKRYRKSFPKVSKGVFTIDFLI